MADVVSHTVQQFQEGKNRIGKAGSKLDWCVVLDILAFSFLRPTKSKTKPFFILVQNLKRNEFRRSQPSFSCTRGHIKKLSCVDSNSSLSSVKSHGITSMEKKKVLLTTFFPPPISLWPILYEYMSRHVKGGNEDHVFTIIKDCFLIHLSYSLPVTESQYTETKSQSMETKTMEAIN